MKRTIIYVFGPKRLSARYFSNTELNQEDGGWLKIGQTSETDDNRDKWECAMGRINQETSSNFTTSVEAKSVYSMI